MQLANQALTAYSPNMVTSGPKKNKMATAKMQTQGFRTAVHKPLGDVTDATSII